VVTEALGFNDNPAELGFLAVLSVEPIYECLSHHKLLPECQAAEWDDFWNTSSTHLVRLAEDRATSSSHSYRVAATVGVFDDSKRFYFNIHCHQPDLMTLAIEAGCAALGTVHHERVIFRNDWFRVLVHCEPPQGSTLVKVAADAAIAALVRSGLHAYAER